MAPDGNSILTSPPVAVRAGLSDARILLLASGMFAIGTDSFVVAGLLGQISATFDVGAAAVGQLVTAYALSYAVFTPVAAVALSSLRRERLLLVGLIVFVSGNLMAAFGASFAIVILGRVVSGLGAALYAPVASAAALSVAPANQRGAALAVMMTALGTATAFGSPLGTFIGDRYGWQTTFLLIGLIALPAACWLATAARLPVAQAAPSMRARLAPLWDPRVIVTLLTTFLVLTGLYSTYTYITVVLDRAAQGNGRLAVLLSIWGIAGTIGTLGSGRLTDRYGSRAVVNATLAVLVLDFVIMPWLGATFAGAAVVMAIWGLCGWAFVIPQQHRLTDFAPERAPVLLSLYATSVYAGTAAAGIVGGIFLTAADARNLPLVGACFILSGLATAELSHRLRRLP